MRKNLYLLSVLMILLIISNTLINANSMEPSEWAKDEIENSINKDLVPNSLKASYQTPIKRYEYVLLALEILDRKGMDLFIKQEYVFKDILGHSYEKEILTAYNAGIISGDGRGYFKPDDNITRQEIAALIVKLLKVLSPQQNFSIDEEFTYSDTAYISNWAKQDINYCYSNGIIKGIGKDKKGFDVINPLGTATREEAILLIYRLANSYDLIAFSNQFGVEIAKKLHSYNEIPNMSIEISNKLALIIIGENSYISLFKLSNGIGLELSSKGKVNDNVKQVYIDLLNTLNKNEIIINKFSEGIDRLNRNNDIYNEVIDNKYTISMKIDDETGEEFYLVNYFENTF